MVAVKIAKAGRTCTQNAREEVNQLNAACKWSEHPGRTHIIDLLEVFEMPGENEWPHVCTVFPVGFLSDFLANINMPILTGRREPSHAHEEDAAAQ